MRRLLNLIVVVVVAGALTSGFAQEAPKALTEKVDALVITAYTVAAEQFPCKVKSGGKLHMIRWQEVDRCLNGAADRVDWEGLARQIESLRQGADKATVSAAVESSLSAHSLRFDQVLNTKDERALLPLTNSLLRFMPADSLHDLPVTDRAGTSVGVFSGVYIYERTGGLSSANTFKLTLFQYTDANGGVQSSTDKLLLDSFGVPWRQAKPQPGFRLPIEKLSLKP